MRLQVRSSGGELTVPSQKEFLLLWQRGIIAPDDLVKRDGVDRWVPAAELPWIRGMRDEAKSDNRRLLWLVVFLMALGLLGILWIQASAGTGARRAPLPRGAVKAVPGR